MLHLVSDGTPHDPAYRVPFTLDRSRDPLFELVNRGDERLRGLSLTLLGSGMLIWGVASVLEPAESLIVRVHVDDRGQNGVLIVRWVRPSDDEYLWRVTL